VKTHVGSLQVVDDAEELARIAADIIVDAARERPKTGLFLAGGTTPRRAYERVAAIANANDFVGVHLWLGDERAVAIEHPDSNAGMILSVWGERLGLVDDLGGGVRIPSSRFHAMPCGRGVDKQIKETSFALTAQGGPAPRPDLTLLGVGADGHTASLFPGDPALEATGLFASARGGARITATRGLLAASRHLVFLVAGDAKAAIVAQVMSDPHSVPAGQVALEAKTAGADVTWLLDRAAVAKIA
jgi:6-phosphogluconolactonase